VAVLYSKVKKKRKRVFRGAPVKVETPVGGIKDARSGGERENGRSQCKPGRTLLKRKKERAAGSTSCAKVRTGQAKKEREEILHCSVDPDMLGDGRRGEARERRTGRAEQNWARKRKPGSTDSAG